MAAFLFVLAALAQAPAARTDTVEIVVVATTDIHGHAYHWDYLTDREAPWGLTRVATVVDSLRRAYPGRVVVVDAGDIIQGNPFATYFATEHPVRPHPVIDAMNAVGYDAAVVGNHEFNFGMDVLDEAERSAAFPLLGANVFTLPRDTVLYRPFVVVSRGGIRVAIGGFTTPGAMVWDRAHLAGRVRIRPVEAVARATLEGMAASGAAVRLVVIHSGMAGASSYDTTGIGPENVAATLATLPVAPHLVVVGHSHLTMTDSTWRGVHFIQPANWAREVSVAHIRVLRDSAGGTRVLDIHAERVSLAHVPPDPAVTRQLASAHAQVRAWVETPLAQTPDRWSLAAARVEDTPLLDLLNDVQRRAAGAQLSAAAAFDSTVTFGPGAILLRDLSALYPYENTLKAVRIDGVTLRAYLEQSAAYFGRWGTNERPVRSDVPGFNYDVVSGVDYAVDVSQPVGQRIVQLSYQGHLVTAADTFTLALNSYRQSGGGGFTMLQGLPVVYDQGEGIRDLLVAAVRRANVLRTADWFTPSWRLLPRPAQAAARALFPHETVPTVRAADTASVAPPPAPRPDQAPALPTGDVTPAVVARLRFPLARTTTDESALADLLADGMRNAARSDLALFPRSLLRGGLGVEVREADARGVVVDTGLVSIEVSGAQVLATLESAVANAGPTLAVSGMVVRWEPGRRAGERVREVRLVDGRRLERDRTYRVAIPAGLLTGESRDEGRLADALLAYLPRLSQPIEPPVVGRWERRE